MPTHDDEVVEVMARAVRATRRDGSVVTASAALSFLHAAGFRVVRKRSVEEIARAICDQWGYEWDGDPDEDDQVAPEVAVDYDQRPDKALYRRTARVLHALVYPARTNDSAEVGS